MYMVSDDPASPEAPAPLLTTQELLRLAKGGGSGPCRAEPKLPLDTEMIRVQ
jgi:hypothetical protein